MCVMGDRHAQGAGGGEMKSPLTGKPEAAKPMFLLI